MVSTGKILAFINALGGGAAAPSEVVILPETVLKPGEEYDADGFVLTAPFDNNFTVGKKYTFKWNGEEYTTKAVDASAFAGDGAFAFGNATIVNPQLVELLGGNPDANAPFFCMYSPTGPEGVYFSFVASDNPASVTLSIVETESASGGGSASAGGGGVFIANGTAAFSDDMTGISGTFDKTIAEVMEAHNAGKLVQLRVNFPDLGSTMLMMASMEADGMVIWQGIIETMIVSAFLVEDGVLQGQVIQLATLNA